MKHKKALVILTAVGVLGASAAVSASGLTQKVSGLLRSDIAISIDGGKSGLHPVYIDGKAYVPIRDAATALGYDVNAEGKQIDLNKHVEKEPEQTIQLSGVVVKADQATDGGPLRLEVRGQGGAQWMILYADKDTVVAGEDGSVKTKADIKEGTHITADYGPIVAMSYPGQSQAKKIVVGVQREIKEDVVSKVTKTDDGGQVLLGAEKDASGNLNANAVVLNVGKDTLIVKENGEPVKLEDLAAGSKVRAYYGPIMTKSLPPQSPAELIVVLGEQ